jgi:putative membrane protein (TIGR04086 family)
MKSRAKMAQKKQRAARTANRKGAGKALAPVIGGTLSAAALTIVLILLLAILLNYGIFQDSWISIANQVIKILGIALAAFLSSRHPGQHLWFRGALAGVLYIFLGWLVFSILAGTWSLNAGNLADVGMGAVLGAAIAMITGKRSS